MKFQPFLADAFTSTSFLGLPHPCLLNGCPARAPTDANHRCGTEFAGDSSHLGIRKKQWSGQQNQERGSTGAWAQY